MIYSPIDYHNHTSHSWDCRIPMAEMIRAAMDIGLQEIAFTDHFDQFDENMRRPKYDAQAYFETLKANRTEFESEGITIRAGVEVGEPHLSAEIVRPVLEKYPYDVVLGSLHFAEGLSMSDATFFQKYPIQEAMKRYFGEMTEMVKKGGFDLLAHLDFPKRRAYKVYGRFDLREFETEVREVWQACIENGIGIEINTAGLRHDVNQLHPTVEALTWYREMGGEILTIGSDAHRPSDIGAGTNIALEAALLAGFDSVTSFENRQATKRLSIVPIL